MSEEFVNEEPTTGSRCLQNLRMKISLMAKTVEGGESTSLVGHREHGVPTWFNSPAVPSSAPSVTCKLALSQDECR